MRYLHKTSYSTSSSRGARPLPGRGLSRRMRRGPGDPAGGHGAEWGGLPARRPARSSRVGAGAPPRPARPAGRRGSCGPGGREGWGWGRRGAGARPPRGLWPWVRPRWRRISGPESTPWEG